MNLYEGWHANAACIQCGSSFQRARTLEIPDNQANNKRQKTPRQEQRPVAAARRSFTDGSTHASLRFWGCKSSKKQESESGGAERLPTTSGSKLRRPRVRERREDCANAGCSKGWPPKKARCLQRLCGMKALFRFHLRRITRGPWRCGGVASVWRQ